MPHITAPASSSASPLLSSCHSALQSQCRHPGWHNCFGTAGYRSPQAAQGCSRYFSSFLASSTSEAGLFLGHEGVLQALQRMRKRMRMSNAMTQLKEIATTAPVERAAPIATVPLEKAGPAARPHTWDARAAIECAASTRRHWQGTKGTAAVLAVGWGWGEAGSRTASPRHGLAARSCVLGFTAPLGRTDQSFLSTSPPLAPGGTFLPPAPGREKVTVTAGTRGQAARAPQGGLWGGQWAATPGPKGLRWGLEAAAVPRSAAVWRTFPAPHTPAVPPRPLRGPPSWRCAQWETHRLILAQIPLPRAPPGDSGCPWPSSCPLSNRHLLCLLPAPRGEVLHPKTG